MDIGNKTWNTACNAANLEKLKSEPDKNDPRIQNAIKKDPRWGYYTGFSEQEVSQLKANANLGGMPPEDSFKKSQN